MTILANAGDYNHTLGEIETDPDWFGDPQGDHLAACHASIVDLLLMHGISSWRGYRYWIVFTTDGIFLHENPYLFASNDKSTWTGIVQVDDQGLFDGQGSSDPALVYDSNLDSMIIYFKRENPGQTEGIFRKTYNSSGTLSAATLVIDQSTFGGLSPAVIKKLSDGNYHCWFIKPDGDASGGANQIYYRSFGSDGLTPGAEQACTVDIIQSSYSGYYPWHIEARENQYIAGRVDIVVACKTIIGAGSYDGMVLVHAQTSFGDPATITTPLSPNLLLAPSGSGWDGTGLYRSSFVLEKSGDNLIMNLAYDGFGTGNLYGWDRIGFTSGILYAVPHIVGLTQGGALTGLTKGGSLTGLTK